MTRKSCERSGSAPHPARSPRPQLPLLGPPQIRPVQKRNVPFLPRSRPAAQPLLKEAGKEGRLRAGWRGAADTPVPLFSSSAGLPGKCAASSSRSTAPTVPEGRIAAPRRSLRLSAISPRRSRAAVRGGGDSGGGLSSGLGGGGRRGRLAGDSLGTRWGLGQPGPRACTPCGGRRLLPRRSARSCPDV